MSTRKSTKSHTLNKLKYLLKRIFTCQKTKPSKIGWQTGAEQKHQQRQHHLPKSIFPCDRKKICIKCSKQIKITKHKCAGRTNESPNFYKYVCNTRKTSWRHMVRAEMRSDCLSPRWSPDGKWEVEIPKEATPQGAAAFPCDLLASCWRNFDGHVMHFKLCNRGHN